MKIKKMVSALLAAVMVFALMCTPAFAANPADTLAEINDNDSIWVGVTSLKDQVKELTFKARYWDYDEGTITKGEATEAKTIGVCELPLGVTLAAGPENNLLMDIWVLTDPDGDGVFEERLEKHNYDKDGNYVSSEVVPVTTAGPIKEADDESYFNAFNWGYGDNFFDADLKGTPGYHTLTTDYLVEMFGANTLILFWDEAGENCFPILLTGKAAPEGVVVTLASKGVFFSGIGDVVSGWAVEPVDEATDAGLLPGMVEKNHNYDLTGKITRAEFAAVAVRLYEAMSGEEAKYTDADPFTDVEADTLAYQYIMAARDLKIVNGTNLEKKTFEPNALVSRQDAALMLSRVFTILGGKIPAGASTTFADDANIAGYAKDAVAFMSANGIINGKGNNRFDPKGNASVEEALKIALEMLNKLDV